MESLKILEMEGCASSQPRFSIPVTTGRDPPLTENRYAQRLSKSSEWFMGIRSQESEWKPGNSGNNGTGSKTGVH